MIKNKLLADDIICSLFFYFQETVWEIKTNNLNDQSVVDLLLLHQTKMQVTSPPESRHVLNLAALKLPEITFWSLWNGPVLMGCAALKHLDNFSGEVKSMKTTEAAVRKGVGKKLINHIIGEAKKSGYKSLKLETGSMAYFEPARKFYENQGFTYCDPFGAYTKDPNNVFMSLNLE